jgi:hypothetical protein
MDIIHLLPSHNYVGLVSDASIRYRLEETRRQIDLEISRITPLLTRLTLGDRIREPWTRTSP